MTNEQLIIRIKNGEAELLNELIQQNKGMIYSVAYRYKGTAERNGGLDLDDLTQSACLGLLESIPYWDEEKGSFLTVAALYMRRSIREALGMHSSKQRLENLNRVVPLDAPMKGTEEMKLSDTIPDPDAETLFEAVEEREIKRIVRAAVDRLPDRSRDVITAYYFDGKTYAVISGGKRPVKDVRRLCAEGLRRLRMLDEIRALHEEYEPTYKHKGVNGFKSSFSSVVEDAAIRRERMRNRLSGMMKLLPPEVPENEDIREMKALF